MPNRNNTVTTTGTAAARLAFYTINRSSLRTSSPQNSTKYEREKKPKRYRHLKT